MRRVIVLFGAAAAVLALPAGASAYIGPGAGVSVLGTVVAFVGAVVFAIVGFVWYPIKRLFAAIRRARRSAEPRSIP
jgi:hypothetical protein